MNKKKTNKKIRRLDESLSIQTIRKSLTGKTDVTIDLSKISISPSGNIQPSNNNPTNSQISNTNRSDNKKNRVGKSEKR